MLVADRAGYLPASMVTEEYRNTSFCTADATTNSFNSMLMCFYIDTALALLVLALGATGRAGPLVVWQALSLFSHGVFHLAQYVYGIPVPDHIDLVLYPAFTLAMLCGFGLGVTVGSPLHAFGVAAVLVVVQRTFVPPHYVFPFANTWIYTMATVMGVWRGVPPKSAVRYRRTPTSIHLPTCFHERIPACIHRNSLAH
jgi:hypothetical protein